MKKRKLYFILPILLLAMLLPVSAHPGKTDGFGGHTDKSTGEYHYHHGYPAHDHWDMDGDGDRDCPYDFDDQTDHSSSIKSDPKPTQTKPVQKSFWKTVLSNLLDLGFGDLWNYFIGGGMFCFPAAIYLVGFFLKLIAKIPKSEAVCDYIDDHIFGISIAISIIILLSIGIFLLSR